MERKKNVTDFSQLSTIEQEEILQTPTIRRKLNQATKGLKKYGQTVSPENLKLSDWCEHALQEICDMEEYVQMVKESAEQQECELTELREQVKDLVAMLNVAKSRQSKHERAIKKFIKENYDTVYQAVVESIEFSKPYSDLIFANITVKENAKTGLRVISGSGRTEEIACHTALYKIVGEYYGMSNMQIRNSDSTA